MIETVISALNEGFLQTLKLFVVTLVGSIPLGLVICFGSMSRWAPLGFLGRKYFSQGEALARALENGETAVYKGKELAEAEVKSKVKWLRRLAKLLLGFRPISLISRLVVRVIRELAERRTTMIIVTHEMHFAREVSDRIIFMDGGFIVEQGGPEIIDNPKMERTRRFLSSYGQ